MPESSLAPKSFIITGGNSGLGLAAAKQLAQQDEDNHVVLACRDRHKAEEAVRSLINTTGNSNVTAAELDLASLQSVRRFVADFRGSVQAPLFAVICNAGVINLGTQRETAEGYEETFGVNHLGHFLLVALLAGDIVPGGRILFVSSGTHDPANKTLVAPPVYETAQLLAHPRTSEENVRTLGQRRYSTSKLCNVYCAYEFADRFQRARKRIDVNVFDPGEMPGTAFSRTFPAPMRFFAKYVNYASVPFRQSVHTATQSGRALATLASSPDLTGTTGKYFERTIPKRSSELSYHADNQSDLWTTSIELTGLKSDETALSLS